MIISPHTERTFDKVQWLIHDYKKTKRKQQKNEILGKVELGDQAPVFPITFSSQLDYPLV